VERVGQTELQVLLEVMVQVVHQANREQVVKLAQVVHLLQAELQALTELREVQVQVG
jgi:hypothetical protein